MGKFRVEIDKNACQGFGACVELCPQFFQLSDVDGKSTIEGAEKVMKENEVVAGTLELDKLEEEGHDYADRQKALEKSFEWGDRIPIGIFYKEEKPTYRDSLPHVKGVPLTKLPTEDIDITPLLESMM